MEISPRRRPWAFVNYGLLVVCLTLGLSQPTSLVASRSRCEALRDWAASYKTTAPTLDTLAAFDRAHRVALFNAVTPAVRSALMQDHLRRWALEPGLSAEQRRLITEGARLLTPEAYTGSDAPAREAFKRFWSQAETSFSTPVLKQPWFDLVRSPPVRSAGNDDAPYCECNIAHPTPPCSGSCIYGGCQLFDPHFGCGPGLFYPCNGMCG